MLWDLDDLGGPGDDIPSPQRSQLEPAPEPELQEEEEDDEEEDEDEDDEPNFGPPPPRRRGLIQFQPPPVRGMFGGPPMPRIRPRRAAPNDDFGEFAGEAVEAVCAVMGLCRSALLSQEEIAGIRRGVLAAIEGVRPGYDDDDESI